MIKEPDGFGRGDFALATTPTPMRQNLDRLDRILRGVLGIWLAVVAVSALRIGRRVTAAIAFVAGIGLLQNAATGYCGCNSLFGLDTTD